MGHTGVDHFTSNVVSEVLRRLTAADGSAGVDDSDGSDGHGSNYSDGSSGGSDD